VPSGAPTSVGTDQVKGAYDYAFARTTSKGSTLIYATGATVPEENRELFVLQKENGQWKIDRYMFNKMN